MEFGYCNNLQELFSIVELALEDKKSLKEYLNNKKSFKIVNRIVDMTSNKIVAVPFDDLKKEDVFNVYYGYDYNKKKYWFSYEI